jgi:hypothetical protein
MTVSIDLVSAIQPDKLEAESHQRGRPAAVCSPVARPRVVAGDDPGPR